MKELVSAGMALMVLHIFFNIVTLTGAPPKDTELPATSPLPKFSCDTPVTPPVQLELFSALGFAPRANPFAGKSAPVVCPEAPPQPLT